MAVGESGKKKGGENVGAPPAAAFPDADAGGDASIRARVEERIREEEAMVAQARSLSAPADGDKDAQQRFVRECLYANELGDGVLYAHLHAGRYVFNKSSQEWMRWTGHHWERDIMADAEASVEAVAERIVEESCSLERESIGLGTDGRERAESLKGLQKTCHMRVTRLRSERGRKNCLKFACTNPVNKLAIRGDELDTRPWLLPCANGVIDLKTGEMRPGRQDDWLEKACPAEWRGIDAPRAAWDAFLMEIFSERVDLVEFVRRLFGYGASGLTVEHVLPILCGQGRNGKGTLVETVSRVLGSLAAPIQSEMLLDQGRSKSSAGPSPDIMALRGLRIAFASENDEGRRFSPSRVKWLSGGDTLVGRAPHDRYETHFVPTHKLFLLTNHEPQAPQEDFAFWERVRLVPFELSFVARRPIKDNERPADKHLMQKLVQEAPGILAWIVQGALEWQQRGLDPPPVVMEATARYRKGEDLVGQFVEDACYVDAAAQVSARALYDAFKQWWEENISDTSLSQKRFGKIMALRYRREKQGTYRYFGIGLLTERGPFGP
jgi:putative DNA primase/helicase